MNKTILPVIGMLFFLLSCQKEETISTTDLINCWTHSYEEKPSDDDEIYRPCDYKEFPFSFFRAIFDIHADGQCDYLVLAPNDAHFMAKGTWELKNNSLLILDENGNLYRSFEIVELGEEKLRVSG